MKFSIALTAVLLVAGMCVGISQRRACVASRAERDRLLEQVRDLGIGREITPRRRVERPSDGRLALPELVALGREIAGDLAGADEEVRERAMGIFERMSELDGAELESLIVGLREDRGLADEVRRPWVEFAWVSLAEVEPAAALRLLAVDSEISGNLELVQRVVAKALGEWAAIAPAAALEWARDSGVPLGEDAMGALLRGMAQDDPEMALRSISELGMLEKGEAWRTIAGAGQTPEARAGILAAFRKMLGGLTNDEEKAELRTVVLSGIAGTWVGDGFDEISSWMGAQNLSAVEREGFAAGLVYEMTGAETGRWIEWVEGAVSPAMRAERVGNLVSQWTQQDYLAAGQWLTEVPDGPAKTPAVCAYAETVAEYEPQVAAQWALTLPAGEARQRTLLRIYQNWPKADAAAAAAFAKEQGLVSDSAR